MHFKGWMAGTKCDQPLKPLVAEIMGTKASEVVMMNMLTVNLHLAMAAFYKPEGSRRKIVIEGHSFPSDRVKRE